MKMIKYNVAKVFTNEIKNIQKVVKNNHYSMNGNFTKKCQQWIEKNLKVKSSILTNSCTAALEMIAILMNLKKEMRLLCLLTHLFQLQTLLY